MRRPLRLWTPGASLIRINRAYDLRRIPSHESVRGKVLGDHRARRDNRVLPYSYATDDDRARCDPHVSLDHNGRSDGSGASPRRLQGMARRDDANVWSDHHAIRDVEASEVIESAVLIYEYILANTHFTPAGSIKRRHQ